MGISKEEAIIRLLAEKNGVSEREIREQMQIAINMAMESDDPEAKKYWDAMRQSGRRPTPEEVIRDIARRLKDQE